jgi:hypothetical protein
MDRPNWRLLLPAVAAGGFVLVGFWGLLLGPLGTAWFLSWRKKRDGVGDDDDEARRLATFMAEAAKAQMTSAARKPAAAGGAAVRGATPALIQPNPATASATASAAPKPSFAELRQRVAQLEGKPLFDAFAVARLAAIENARDAHATVEIALIARRAAVAPTQAPLRLRAAARAIATCLANGQAAMAAALFGEFISERTALQLAPEHWEPLGRALLGQGALMEAAWALHAGAVLGNDLASAQKRLIEVAGKAAETGKPSVALKLYGTVLAKYPDTQYADFVRTNMRIEEKKLGKGSAPA